MNRFWTLMLAGLIAVGMGACSKEKMEDAKAEMSEAAEATKDAAMEMKAEAGEAMEASADMAGGGS